MQGQIETFRGARAATKPMRGLNPIDAVSGYFPTRTYGLVRTRDLLNVFADRGWVVASEQHSTPRIEERCGYQRHLIRLCHRDFERLEGMPAHHDCRPELVMLNSHDRSTSFRLWWGLLRLACMNGLIAGDVMGSVRINHTQKVIERLGDGIEDLMNRLPDMLHSVKTMATAPMTASACADFVRQAYTLRFAEHGRLRMSDLKIDYTLPTRRLEDEHTDVFTVANKIQEVCMRGGIAYSGTVMRKQIDGSKAKVTVSRLSRRIVALDSQISLNQAIYAMAMRYT